MKVEDFLKTNKPIINEVKYHITKKKEKEDLVIIYFDNNEKIYVSVESYFKYGLNMLEGIDDKLYETLIDEQRLLLAYRSVLRKLSVKDYTVKQINDYLKQKHILTNIEIQNIISKLINYDLLNDERYTENKVNYLAKQLLSIKQIKAKLIKDGISNDLIEKYAIINIDDEYDKANKLALKYSNSIKNKSVNAAKQSILMKIVALGYSYDSAKSAVDNLNLRNDNELDLLKKEYQKAKIKYAKKYEDYELKNHIYSYLINKGFKSEDIKVILEAK